MHHFELRSQRKAHRVTAEHWVKLQFSIVYYFSHCEINFADIWNVEVSTIATLIKWELCVVAARSA